MKTTAEIINLLKSYKSIAASKYGLTKIGIFGSVARGEQTENSDVDICYEGRVPSFLTLDIIQTDLENLFGAKVDLVRVRDQMNHLLKQRIMKEGIYV
jgi:predicted nucleotidyltransferase